MQYTAKILMRKFIEDAERDRRTLRRIALQVASASRGARFMLDFWQGATVVFRRLVRGFSEDLASILDGFSVLFG